MGTPPYESDKATESKRRRARLLEWLYDHRAKQAGEYASIVAFLGGEPDEHTMAVWRDTLRMLERDGLIILAESKEFLGTSARLTGEGAAEVEAERARKAAAEQTQPASALRRAWRFIEHQRFAALIAVVGVIIAALAYANDLSQRSEALPSPTPVTTEPRPDVPAASSGKIFLPRGGCDGNPKDRIPEEIAISGVARITDGRLWLFVGFPDNGNWFPANGNQEEGAQADRSITVEPDGTWRQPSVEFGDDKQKDQCFDLLLADVGPQGAAQLAEYFKKQDETREAVGIPRGKLASDIRPLDSIAVRRERQ